MFASDTNDEWRNAGATPPVGHNEARMTFEELLAHIQSRETALADGEQLPPHDIGQLEGLKRWQAINGAMAVAIARISRLDLRECPLAVSVLYFVAVNSDNEFGRCTHGAERIGNFLGCNEKTVRRTLDALIQRGGLQIAVRPGKPPALWLPYLRSMSGVTAFDLISALAPDAKKVGRPSKVSKTPDTMCPDISKKTPDTICPGLNKTPDMEPENPGHYVSDGNSSCTYSRKVSEGRKEEGAYAPAPASATQSVEVGSDRARSTEVKIAVPLAGEASVRKWGPSPAPDMLGADADPFARLGIELPGAICDAIGTGRVKPQEKQLLENISKVLREGLDVGEIRRALDDAVAKPANNTPLGIVGTACKFVLRAPDFARDRNKGGAPERSGFVCKLGSVAVDARDIEEIASETGADFDAVRRFVRNSAYTGFQPRTNIRVLDDVKAHFAAQVVSRRSSTVDLDEWSRATANLPLGDVSLSEFAERCVAAFERARAACTNSVASFLVPFGSALEWVEWFAANRERISAMFGGVPKGSELLGFALCGDDLFACSCWDFSRAVSTARATGFVFDDRRWLRVIADAAQMSPDACDVSVAQLVATLDLRAAA